MLYNLPATPMAHISNDYPEHQRACCHRAHDGCSGPCKDWLMVERVDSWGHKLDHPQSRDTRGGLDRAQDLSTVHQTFPAAMYPKVCQRLSTEWQTLRCVTCW